MKFWLPQTPGTQPKRSSFAGYLARWSGTTDDVERDNHDFAGKVPYNVYPFTGLI